MGITIGSNIMSLRAQRQLGQASDRLSSTFERLSSGQRINRASDDAAGLAISETLNVNSQVYAQAVRNINDGLSLLNIAEGAVRELSSIVIRQKELAQQAANGVLSNSQRLSLDKEANELVSEYNRIVETTTFNGRSMLTSSDSAVSIQAGYGEDGMLDISFASKVITGVGDGTFEDRTSFATGDEPAAVTLGDLNGDGVLDMVVPDSSSSTASVMLGNGNGTFEGRTSFSTGLVASNVVLEDLNGNGVLDLVTPNRVLLGNGDGTFEAPAVVNTFSANSVALGDLNGDGMSDMVVTTSYSDTLSVLLGNGDGTFNARTSFVTGDNPRSVALGDLNGDGLLDLVVTEYTSNTVSVMLGTGDGSFSARTSYGSPAQPCEVVLGDLNGDGALDLVHGTKTGNRVIFRLGNGDGSFEGWHGFYLGSGTNPMSVSVGDLNGDGALDIVAADRKGNSSSVFIGVGDGTFSAGTSFATGLFPVSVKLGDLNGDGVLDMVTADRTDDTVSVLLGNVEETVSDSTLSQSTLNLRTRLSALTALDTLEDELTQITQKLGDIGVVQSRLSVAAANLTVMRENVVSAKSRITDADIAQESAQLVRNQILQQAGSAVLSQANQAPALAFGGKRGINNP